MDHSFYFYHIGVPQSTVFAPTLVVQQKISERSSRGYEEYGA